MAKKAVKKSGMKKIKGSCQSCGKEKGHMKGCSMHKEDKD